MYVDLKGLSLSFKEKRRRCKLGDNKPRGCPLSKRGDCSFAVGSYIQGVSSPWALNPFPQGLGMGGGSTYSMTAGNDGGTFCPLSL